uniref:Ferric reductase NAD binding domain-containing protein n=1 Tax=Vitrella brassicaformis TaxID=1169539 RepID=A0A7S1KEA9_9ALVE
MNAQKVGCAYWSFRDAGMFDVMANHFRHIPTDKCGFFLTNKEATDSDLIALNGEGDARVQRGRGNLTDFLTQAAEKLQTSPHPPKHIGVFVCGPEAMAQEAWRFTQADGWCNGRMHLMLEVFRFG